MRVFEAETTQPQVTGFLQRALDAHLYTHAYLLAGSSPEELANIALRFAAGLVAEDDEEQFALAMRGAHPDVHVFSPGGAAAYLVEQLRELVHDAELAPVRSRHKAYIIESADKLAGAPANAFLKTLEEPAEGVVFLLLAPHEEGVLETLRSRCEVLVCNERVKGTQASPVVVDLLRSLARGCDNRTLMSCAGALVAQARDGLEELELEQAKEIEANSDYLSAAAVKELEQQHKRERTARERAALFALIEQMRSLLRDCIAVKEGAAELAGSTAAGALADVASAAGSRELMEALEATKRGSERITYNVTPQLAVEAMSIEIREALCRK